MHAGRRHGRGRAEVRSVKAKPLCLLGAVLASSVCVQAQTPAPSSVFELHEGLCPATLRYWPESPATSEGTSAGLAFGFESSSPRRLDEVTMIADTDGGWYLWTAGPVAIDVAMYGRMFSRPAVAAFDKPVTVRHAWITDVNGTPCGVPAFGSADAQADTALATNGWTRVVAKAVRAPYDTNCPRPFAAAFVARVASAEYPRNAYPGVYAAEIYVVVGDHDNLVDARMYKPSVNADVNANALAAARASKYRSAVSYCRKVSAEYLFKVNFSP